MKEPTAGRRLRPGHHLYRGRDGRWRLAAPGDRFTTVSGPDEVLAAVQRRAARPAADNPAADAALLVELERALQARGLLESVTEETPAGGPWTVIVSGRNPVGRATAQQLEPFAEVRLVDDVQERDVQGADTLVTCAGWLPDARWQVLDGWCVRYGTDWHSSYLEGITCYLGPMYVPGVTASYRDTRGRRLAAAAHPDELRGLWSYLDDGLSGRTPLPAVPWPDPPGAAVVAGLLVTDLLARRQTGRPASAGHQLAVDLATATVVRHPVLPLPGTAPVAERAAAGVGAPAGGEPR